MDIEKLLLSWDEFNQKEFSVPYFFEIQKDNQLLIYCGVRHSYKPNDKHFPVLQEKWDKFLANQNPNKIGIGEGGVRPLIKPLEDAITKYGEQGWVKFVADKADIEIVSPDITDFRLWNALLNKYTKEELFYYDILQTAYQWNGTDKKVAFKKYVQQWTIEFEMKWPGFDASWEKILKIHSSYSKKEFDPEDCDYLYNNIDPSQKNSKLNQLGRDIDIIRDSAVVSEIKKLWDDGKSIFAIFGSGHAIIQQPALEHLLK